MPADSATLSAAAPASVHQREAASHQDGRSGRPSLRFSGPRVGLYRTIVADVPWPERGAGKIKRGANRHYSLMSVAEIAALPVGELADPAGCHLYFYATNNYLREAFFVLDCWGFEFVTCRTWVKAVVDGERRFTLQRAGLGQYFRGETEQLLFARRGPVLPYKLREDGSEKRAQAGTALIAPRSIHSAKPPQGFEDAELVSYPPRLSLFERTRRDGWDAFGDEIESDVILEQTPALDAPMKHETKQLTLGGFDA